MLSRAFGLQELDSCLVLRFSLRLGNPNTAAIALNRCTTLTVPLFHSPLVSKIGSSI